MKKVILFSGQNAFYSKNYNANIIIFFVCIIQVSGFVN